MAQTTPTRSPSSRKGGGRPRPGKQRKPSYVSQAKASAPGQSDSPRGRASQPGPVREAPFWAVAGFLALYGIQQEFPQVHELGPVWHTALIDSSHALAVGLGLYFTVEAGKRARAWIRSKVHIRVEGSIRLGEQRTGDQEPRGS